MFVALSIGFFILLAAVLVAAFGIAQDEYLILGKNTFLAMLRNGHKVRKNVYIYLRGDLNVRIGAILVVAVKAYFFKISCQRKLAWQLYLTDSNRMRDLIVVSCYIGVVAETGEKRGSKSVVMLELFARKK